MSGLTVQGAGRQPAFGQARPQYPAARQGNLVLSPPAGPLESAFIAIALAEYIGAVPLGLITGGPEALGAIDSNYTLAQGFILVGTLLFALRRWKGMVDAALRVWPFAIPFLFIALSVIWSDSAGRTVRRVGAFGTVHLFALYAYAAIGPLRIMRMVAWAAVIACLASILLLILVPQYAYDEDVVDAVRGVFGQKNLFGQAMVLGTVSFSYMILDRRHLRWSDIFGLATVGVGLALCRSASSIAICIMAVGLTLIFLQYRKGGLSRAISVIMALVVLLGSVVLFSLFDFNTLLDSVGKDTTLTGRLEIWAAVERMVNERPLFGAGFAAFWLPNQPQAEELWLELGWDVSSAHSGFLETALEIGYLGLAATVMPALVLLWRAIWRLADVQRQGIALWSLIYMVSFALLNYDESRMLGTSATWVFCMLPMIALGGKGQWQPLFAAHAGSGDAVRFRQRVPQA